MLGSLRIPVSEFRHLQLTKDYCSRDVRDEAARKLVEIAAWLWTWLICRIELHLFLEQDIREMID